MGNVSVVPEGKQPETTPSVVTLSDGELDFTQVLADVGILDRVGLAGAQEKASARTIAVPASVGSSDAIIKISPPEYPKVVENEQKCLSITREAARRFADVAQAELLVDKHGTAGLLVHRFDRGEEGRRYAVEDATQILGVYPAQKYDITYEELSRVVLGVVGAPMVAANNLAFQLAMAWLLGNGDLHGKNISVLRRNGRFDVAPIYDIPSTVPYGDTTLALTVQGRRDGLSRKRFFSYTDEMGLPRAQAERVADAALAATEDAAARISHAAGFDARSTRDLSRVLRKRRRMWGD